MTLTFMRLFDSHRPLTYINFYEFEVEVKKQNLMPELTKYLHSYVSLTHSPLDIACHSESLLSLCFKD